MRSNSQRDDLTLDERRRFQPIRTKRLVERQTPEQHDR
jgi:hypothetical protein